MSTVNWWLPEEGPWEVVTSRAAEWSSVKGLPAVTITDHVVLPNCPAGSLNDTCLCHWSVWGKFPVTCCGAQPNHIPMTYTKSLYVFWHRSFVCGCVRDTFLEDVCILYKFKQGKKVWWTSKSPSTTQHHGHAHTISPRFLLPTHEFFWKMNKWTKYTSLKMR